MGDHLRQLLMAIEEVEQMTIFLDNGFHVELALKVVEMRDHFKLKELACVSTVHDAGVCITGLLLTVKYVKCTMQKCLAGGWVQAVLQIRTNEVELLEILLDLDRYCKQMYNAMLKDKKGDTCGQMNEDAIMYTPQEYKGFQVLMERREKLADVYFNKVLQRLKKEIDAAKESGKLKESQFIACILLKLTDRMGTEGLLDVKWAEVVQGSYLGQGSFGYVMKSNLFGEALAFKTLKQLREAEIQATLHHPGIVQILCCLQSTEGRFMVMELMSMNLSQYLKLKLNEEGLELRVAIDVILQIARAMYYLHCQGVAHRDLKSSNVMVKVPASPDGYVQVKLGDFGLARFGLYAKDQNVGTARFRAPEISDNPEGIERDLAKADVYSFALTCYHILTCQEPFAKIAKDHLQKEVVELGKRPEFSECYPSELVSLISRCWATDSKERPDFKTICNELQVVFTRLSGDITVTSGPAFIGEGNLEVLAEVLSDNLENGIMPLAALNALELGKHLESQGQYEDALKKYNEANEVQPRNVCILERRGHAKRELGKLSEALDDLNEANKLAPEYGDVLVERGIVKLITGDRMGALEDIDKYIILQPKMSFGFYVRGRVKHSLSLYKEALVDFDEAHKLGRKASLMFGQRALTKMALGDYRGAIADFDAISPIITSQDLCCRATSKGYLNDVQGALGDYDKAARRDPYNPNILRGRANFKLSVFDTRGAMEDSLKASELIYPSVDYFPDLVFRGQVRAKSNNFHGTLEELNTRTVRERLAQNASFWGFQAYHKSKTNDRQGALDDIEKANELQPNNALHLCWRGQIKLMLNDVEGAEVDFEKVRELDSGNVALIWERVSFKFTLCDYDGALRDLNMLLEFDPSNWNALFTRGEVKRMLNDFEGALADYTGATIINSGIANIWAQMGYVRQILQHDSISVLADYNKALDIQPLCSSALKTRGAFRGVLKDYAGSLKDLDMAHKLQPYDTYVLIARAHVKSLIQDLEGALEDQQKAISLAQDGDGGYLHGYQNYSLLQKHRYTLIRFLLSIFFLWIILVILEALGIHKDPFDPPLFALIAWLRNCIGNVTEYIRNHVHSSSLS